MVHPAVSILMPAKNAELFISAAIQSVIEQEFQNWELLVIDDFSTDTTFQCVEKWVQKDSRIKLFPNKFPGIIPALQMAFEHSTGAYITRMDADDLMSVGKLRNLHDIVVDSPRTIATGCVKYFSDTSVSDGYRRYEDWLNKLVEKNEFYTSLYRECIIASPNWMVHRSCFENDFCFNELNYPEDYDMVFHWYKSGYVIRGVNEITHLWREHPNRTSRHHDAYQQESFFWLKTNYFADLEIEKGEKVQLFGAAAKGRMVAKILMDREVNFDWFDFGTKAERLIGRKKVQPVSEIRPGIKSILTAWPLDAKMQENISAFLSSRGFEPGKNVWLF